MGHNFSADAVRKIGNLRVYGRFVEERDQQTNTVADRKEPLTALVVAVWSVLTVAVFLWSLKGVLSENCCEHSRASLRATHFGFEVGALR